MKTLHSWLARSVLVTASLALLLSAAPASSAAATPPFDRLPPGPVPAAVPYAIGAKIFYRGTTYVVPTPPGVAYSDVWRAQPYHGNVLASVYQGAVDPYGIVGAIGSTTAWRKYGDVDMTADATLDGRLVMVNSSPHEARLVDTSTGRIIARLPVTRMFGDVKAVGSKVLVTMTGNGSPTAQVLWDPATGGTTRLPGGGAFSVAQRQAPGWLWRQRTGGCYARVPLSTPLATGTTVCQDPSQSFQAFPPLLSFDGSTAVAVRGGRLVVVAVDTGQVLSTGTMAPIVANSDGSRDVHGAQWESTSAFIAHATWDGQLALVRCRVSDGRCQLVVRSHIRGTVHRIVVGW
jgi:hypothetical protein